MFLVSFTSGIFLQKFNNYSINYLSILSCRILLGVPEVAWTVVGSVGVFSSKDSCITSEITLRVVQGLVIFNWILVALFMFGVILVFDPLGHHHGGEPSADARSNAPIEVGFEQRTRIWEWRCKFLCCSCCSSNNFYLTCQLKL